MQIGPYLVEAEIGRGGAGVVFRARSPQGLRVAIKVLNRTERAAVLRFEREAAVQKTVHAEDGFVPLIDAGDYKESRYIVMPFLAGGTLRDKLRQGPLSVVETLEIAEHLARSLGRVHERSIVHRDLKPENVLFDDRGLPVIADLGLAKSLQGSDGAASLSKTGVLIGTPGYMAPEQARDAKSSGPEVDVFALGAIIHECLAGEPAFNGRSTMEIIEQVDSGRVVPIRKLRPEVPRWLESVILRALAPDPDRRFEDGAALLEALERRVEVRAGAGRYVALGLLLLVLGATGATAVLLATRPKPPVAAPPPPPARPMPPAPAPPPPPPPAAPVPPDAAAETSSTRARVVFTRSHDMPNTDFGERSPEAVSLFREGVQLAESGRLDEAMKCWRKASELEPGWAAPISNIGMALLERGQFEECLVQVERSLELDPRNPRDWVNKGAALGSLGRIPEALEAFERCLAIDPDRAVALRNRGLILGKLGRIQEALADLERLCALEPRDASNWRTLATTYFRAKDGRRALEAAAKAVEVDPNDAENWAARALAYAELREMDRSIADADRALALDPNHQTALNNRGMARFERGDRKGALEDFDRLIERGGGSPRAHLNRGVLRRSNKDMEGAIADFEKVLELDPDGHEAELVRKDLAKMRSMVR